jgi:hypothetical protein
MEHPNPSISDPEIRLILDVLNGRPFTMPADMVNGEKFVELARFHDLSELLFFRLQEGDPDLRHRFSPWLRPKYLANIYRNLAFWNEFIKVSTAFTENNIAMLPIKGMDILARFYPSFDLRSMCDIDILVKEDQLAEAERVISALGYQRDLEGLTEEYWREKQCHFVFHKEHMILEVHWGLDFKRGKREILPGIWDRRRKVEPGEHKLKIFSPEDAVFAFALHLRRFGNILCLKQVFDTAQIISKTADFDWDYVLEESRRGQMQATLYFLLAQVSLFTDTPVPEGVLKRIQVPFWQRKFIEKFLLKYTFLNTASLKSNFLKAHFLLYDSLIEAVSYLINIPHEQFCKYYHFAPYAAKSMLLYRVRLIYMPLRHILGGAVSRSYRLRGKVLSEETPSSSTGNHKK